MIETVSKNLWLLLTLVIPGFCTYGIWRLLLLLEPSTSISIEAIDKIDDSTLVSSSIIIGIALSQQAFSIAFEAVLSLISKIKQKSWPNFYFLFCERFELASAGKLNESATRIVGNFFLSVNMSVGMIFLLLYFVAYKSLHICHWIPVALIVLFIVAIITSIYRMLNAKWAIEECKKS